MAGKATRARSAATARRARLDAELVRRGLVRSRAQAAELIEAGQVMVSGQAATKAATQVGQEVAITIQQASTGPDYASRGGHKLAGALAAFTGLAVAGRRCLDAGASTGGFTDVLLRAGAAEVVAADVGYGQLAWKLRSDPRVTVVERTNARELSPETIGGPVDLVVADLSFISLATVLPALAGCAWPNADIVPMVKPQFEVGKGQVGPGGVVHDPQLRADSVLAVACRAGELGWHTVDVTASPLPGPSGNVEYFLWLRAQTDRSLSGDGLVDAVQRAVQDGPSTMRAGTARGGGTSRLPGRAGQSRRGPQ